MNKYAGKNCPYCKTKILETDDIAVCDICEMPHHKDCWFENGECTTFGCTGKIKELLPYIPSGEPVANNARPQPQPTAFTAAQPQNAPPAPNMQSSQQKSFAFCIYCGNRYTVGDMFCQRCGKKIQSVAPISKEEQEKRQYEQAIKLLEAKRYDEALQSFNKLADYGDSKEKAQECILAKENARKELIYVSSVAFLTAAKASEADLKNAISSLQSIEDYKDAKEKVSELEKRLEKWYEAKKAAEEAARKKQYETAVSHFGAGRFDEAISIFTSLGEYSDCKKKIEKCLEAKETARKEDLYIAATDSLSDDHVQDYELKHAIEILESISDYKDSKEKRAEVEARLEKWYADKAAAEEAERIRKAKAKAKARKTAIISIVMVFIIGAIVAGIVFVTTPYSIVYNLDGGSIGVRNADSYTMLTEDITLGNPTRQGYTFIGWTGTDLDSPNKNVTISRWSFGDRSYTANWEANSYTITFDADGGTVEYTTQSIAFDSNIELPTPTKEGYTFAGWYVGSKLYQNGKWKYATDVTLTAKWAANDYTITLEDTSEIHPGVVVTFNPNYRGASSTTVNLTNGQILTYPTNPIRVGYVFTGWYTNETCTAKYNFSGDITSNMTLYAGWSSLAIRNNSSSPWSVSGNTLTSTNKGYYSSSSEYRITAAAPVTISFKYKTSSESGYDYLYIKKNGVTVKSCSGSTSYVSYSVTLSAGDYLSFIYSKDSSGSYGSDCAYISDLTYTSTAMQTSTATARCSTTITYQYVEGETATQKVTFDETFDLPVLTRRGYGFLGWYYGDTKVEASTWTFASDVTLTPRWEVGGNTITLDANGGTVSSNSLVVSYDRTYILPIPTRTGYSFGGWFSGNKQYISGTWRELDDVTLVARWIANSYTVTYENTAETQANVVVTFDYNYSGSTATSVTLSNGQTLSYPNIPTRSGYVFAGWYTNRDCTTKYNFNGTLTENITLYAKWLTNSKSNVVNVGSNISVYISGTTIRYYAFVPLVSETITVYSSGSYDTYGYLFNSSLTQIKSDDDNGSGSNFSYSYSVTAGTLYYIGVTGYSSSTTGTVSLYVSGSPKPTSTATANSGTINGYVYDASSSVSSTVIFDSDYELITPVRTGYSFLGWYNGDTKIESGNWNINSNVTLTAKWEAGRNTITLDPNGGSVSNTSVAVTYDAPYTLPVPTRTGYTFDGWFAGTTQYVSGTWREQSNITLVAKWTVKTYNLTLNNAKKHEVVVTFDNNYAGSVSTTVTLDAGERLSYPGMPTRSGYVFTGWYTNASCTSRYDFTGDITDDMTLYAGWVDMSLGSVYSEGQINPADYTSSTDYYYVSTSGTSSSYRRHIYLVAEETGTHYIYWKNYNSYYYYGYYLQIYNLTKGTTIRSYSNTYSTSYQNASFTCSKGDVIVISLYRYNTSYSSTAYFYFSGFASATSSAVMNSDEFDYSAGSTYSEQITYGEAFTLPTLSRTDYRFLGWYNENTKVESGTWNYDSNLTLTPKWEEIVYYNVTFEDVEEAYDKIKVTYNYNYSGSTNSVVELGDGETLNYPTNPTRSGYVFTGWYIDATCSTRYTFSGTLTEDITLYAGWGSYSTSNNSWYPWNVSNGNLTSTNKNNSSSSSFTITAYSPIRISFNYSTSSETSYDYLYIYKNGSQIKSCSGITSPVAYTVTLNEGEYLTFTYSKDSSQSNGSDCAYITNLTVASNITATSTAVAQCSNVAGVAYKSGSSVTVRIGYGESYTLPTLTRAGYTFLGWYNGNTKVESGTWNIASNVTLKPKWQ